MIRGVLIGDDRVKAWVESRYPAIQGKLNQSMARLVLKLAVKIKAEKLSGQVLKYRTGTLRRSISPRVIQSDPFVTGEVGTNVEYASIHEFGGKTPAHEIRARRKKALAFMMGGKQVFAKSVQHPGSKFPERSFMRTALREMTPEILAEFQNSISEVIRP